MLMSTVSDAERKIAARREKGYRGRRKGSRGVPRLFAIVEEVEERESLKWQTIERKISVYKIGRCSDLPSGKNATRKNVKE